MPKGLVASTNGVADRKRAEGGRKQSPERGSQIAAGRKRTAESGTLFGLPAAAPPAFVSPPGTVRLGTQGFAFDDWVGPFYPPGTPKARFLEEYARRFPTVEIDSTFYGEPRPSVVEGWAARTPPGFRFSAKFPRLITHEAKLAESEAAARTFVETMSRLGEKLGVLTLQFAFDFGPEHLEVLGRFLDQLPRGPRYAVEVRNRGWLRALRPSEAPPLRDLLARRNVALVLQDLYYMPRMDWITADFTVVRWLGRRSDIERFDRIQIDRSRVLGEWADRASAFLGAGIDLWGYFNNHFAGHSPASARQFGEILEARQSGKDTR
jgi:uncharacterized protein YecE (DUF72 family)